VALIGGILTGANADGAQGLRYLRGQGGLTVVQSVDSAEFSAMPLSGIEAAQPDHILPLDEIGRFLNLVCNRG